MKKMSKKELDKCLSELSKRRQVMGSAVAAVVKGFSPALFVWGPPGLGKSHELTLLLDGAVGKAWRHHTAYSTPKALMMSIAEDTSSIHLFEDCEKMLKNELTSSILRAACGSPNDRERIVTYETANETIRVRFTGGIIVASNENLARSNGPMQGVASRFRPMKWDMSLPERVAMLTQIASYPHRKGGVDLSPKECGKVLSELLELVDDSQSELPLDLRLFTEHALPAYAQSKVSPDMNWKDLLLSKLSGLTQTDAENQAQRTQRLTQLAQKIHMEGGKGADKLVKWKSITGLGQAIYYRHLRRGLGKVK